MKKIIRTLTVALVALLFYTTSSTSQAAPPNTGIQGRAALYLSMGTPSEIEPGFWISPGDIMMSTATSFTVLSAHSGRQVGRFSTDGDGTFTVSLPPGKYVVVPDTLSLFAAPFTQSIATGSFEVTVNAKEFTYVLILYYHEGGFGLTSET